MSERWLLIVDVCYVYVQRDLWALFPITRRYKQCVRRTCLTVQRRQHSDLTCEQKDEYIMIIDKN